VKKREFATKLLFWLLPWPISKALPRSLRIYYFGPAGGPPPGFYDYYGVPGDFWADPYNPPYVPPYSGQPIPPAGWITALDDTYWKTEYYTVWNIDHWDFTGDFTVGIQRTGEWSRGYRPTKIRVTHDYGAGLRLGLFNYGEPGWVWTGICVSGVSYDLDFSGDSDADIKALETDSGEEGCDFDITNIEFFS